MNAWKQTRRLMLVVAAAGLLASGPVGAAESRHTINAKGVGQDLGDGVTRARILGGGLLNGTTVGNFVITDFSSAPVLPIAGTVTFTTNRSTLTVTVVGTFNVATGYFTAAGPVTGATGKLAGASGQLLLEGVEDLSTGAFVEDVTGVIYVDLAPE